MNEIFGQPYAKSFGKKLRQKRQKDLDKERRSADKNCIPKQYSETSKQYSETYNPFEY